eukprot:scaffold1843_cov89-Skeletonema_marinoi.AAC.1
MDITKEMQDIFLADLTTHATTATAGLARISIEKFLRYLLPTHTTQLGGECYQQFCRFGIRPIATATETTTFVL